MTDPVADLLTRIRNALMRKKMSVNVPYSKLKHELSKLLVKEGFLESVKKVKKDFDELQPVKHSKSMSLPQVSCLFQQFSLAKDVNNMAAKYFCREYFPFCRGKFSFCLGIFFSP